MNKVEAIVRPEKLNGLKDALADAGSLGLNVLHVTRRGVQRGGAEGIYGVRSYTVDMLPKVKIELMVSEARTQ